MNNNWLLIFYQKINFHSTFRILKNTIYIYNFKYVHFSALKLKIFFLQGITNEFITQPNVKIKFVSVEISSIIAPPTPRVKSETKISTFRENSLTSFESYRFIEPLSMFVARNTRSNWTHPCPSLPRSRSSGWNRHERGERRYGPNWISTKSR